MVIEQAMGTSKGRAAGLACLRGFVEEMKASGWSYAGIWVTARSGGALL